jgi:hypothetical protein
MTSKVDEKTLFKPECSEVNEDTFADPPIILSKPYYQSKGGLTYVRTVNWN